MKRLGVLAAALILAIGSTASQAQSSHKEPKSEEAKLRKARMEDPTTRQVTPDPKKSPAKHADNLSKNVNHEANRESKDINHTFQGKGAAKHEIKNLRHARVTDHTTRQVTPDPKKSPAKHADNLSKNVNHEMNRTSKDINHFFQGKNKKKKSDNPG